ncbi:hypothetical protein C0J52_02128 [Blattella germanica]|nr:hypothetical protein C0J52_02128 [Blattella germanica]
MHHLKPHTANIEAMESKNDELCFEQYAKSIHKAKKIYPEMNISKIVKNISKQNYNIKPIDVIFGSVIALKPRLQRQHPMHSVCSNIEESSKSHKTTDIIFGSIKIADLEKKSTSDCINTKQNTEPIKEKQINPDFIDSAVSNSNETSEGTTHRKQEQSKQNSESNICLHTKFGTNAEGLANQDKKLDFSKTKQIGRATIAKINTLPKIEKTESHSSNLPTHDTKTLLYANNASSNFESKVKNSKILNSTKETIDTETGVISLNNIILNTHADMNPKRLKNKTEIKLSNTISKNILPITNNNGINIDDKYINSSNHSTSQTEYKTILSSVGDASAIKDKGKAETVKTSRVNEENVNIKVKNKQETVQDKSDLENMPQKEKCIPSKEIIGASTSTPNTQESAQKKEDVMDNEWKQTTESSEKSSYKQLAKLLVKTVLKCTPVNNNSSMTCELRPTGIINTAINRSLDNSIQASDKDISSLEGKEFNQKNDSIQWLMTVGLAIDKEKHDNNTSRTQSLRKSSSEIFNRFNMQFPKLESKKSETYFQKQAGKDDNKEITPCISEERFDRCLTKYMEEESNSSQVLSPPNIETELKPAKIHFIDNETIQFSADNMDKISENHSKSPTAELDVNSIFQKTLRPKPAPSLRSSPTKTIDSFYSSLLDNSDIFEIENTLIITEIVPKPKPVRNDFKASNINDTSSLPADEREVILNENNIKAITESHSNKTQFTIKNEEFKPSVLISKNCASEEQIKNVENHRKRALQNTRSNSEISHNKNEMTSLNFLSKNKTKIPRPVSAPLQGLIETRNKVTSNHENQNLKLSAPKLLKTNPSLKKCKSTDPVPNYHKPLSVIYETSNKNKTAETKHLGPPKKKLPKMYSLEQVNLPASFSQFDHEQFQSQYLNDPNVNELENKTNLTRSSASNASTDHSVSNVNRKDDHSGRSIQKVNLLNATSDNKKKLIKPNIEYIRTNLNKAKEGRSIVKQSPKNISKSSTHQSAAKNMPEDELSRKVQASIQKALAKVSKKHSITTPNTKNVILLEKNINKPSHIVDNGVANSFNIRKEKCKQLLQDRIMKYTKKREKIEKSKNATFSLPETLPNNTELKGTETTNIEISTTDLKLVSSQENKTLTNINNVRLKNRFEKIKEEKRKNINSLTNKLSLKNTKNNRSHQISVKLNTIDEFSVEKRGQKLTENNIQFMKTIFPSDQKKMNQNSEEQNNMSVNENIKKICPITDESVMMKKSYAGTSEMAHKQTPHNKSKSSSCLKDDNGNLSSHDHDDDLKVKDKHYVQFIPSNDIQSFLSSQNQILNTELQKSIYEENIQKISNKLLENIQYENRICTKFKNQDDINSNLIALQKPVLLDTDKEKMLSNHIFKDRNPKKQNKELTSFNTNVQDNSHFIDKTSCTAREHEVNDTLNNIKINTETFEVIYMVDTEWSSSKAQVDMKISGPEKESTSSNSRAKFILDYLKKKYEAPEKTNTKDILTLKRDRNSMNIEKLNEMDDFLKSNNHNYSNPSALSQSIEKIEAQVGISKYKQQPIVEPPTVIPSTKSNLAESNVIDDNRNCVTEENKTTSLKFEKNNLDTTQQERKTEDSIINIKNDLQNKEIYKKDLKEFETSCSFTQGSEFEQVNLSNCKNVIKHRNNQLIKCDNSEIKDKESFSLISNAVHNFHPNSSIQQDRESQHSINSNKTDLLNEEIFTKSTYGCRTVENNTEESEFRPVNLSNMKSLIEHRINQLTKHDNCDIRVKENLSTFTGAPKLKMVNAHQIKLHVSESEPFLDYKVKTNEPNLKINLTDVLNHNNNLSISVQEKDKLQCNIFQTEEENNTLKENSEIKLSPPTISINDSPIPYDLQPKTIMCQNNDESRLVEAQTSKPQIVQIQSKETLRTSCTKIEDHKIQNDDFHCSDDKASINKSKEALSSKYSTSEQSQQKYSKTGGGKCYISNSLTTNQEVIDIKKTSTDIDKFKKFMLPTCNWDILKTYAFPTSPVDSATDEDLSTISSLPCSFQSDKLYPLEKDNICHSRKSETTDKIISFCGKSTDGIQNMKSYFVNNLSPSKLNLNSSVISKERSIENNLNGNSKFLTLIEALQLSEIRLHKAVTQTNLENENDTKLLRNSLSDTNTGIELENPKFQSISFIDISSSSIPLDNTEGTLAKEVHTSTENLGMKTITNENMISTGTSSHTSTVLAMIQPDLTVNETGKSEETHENVLSSDEPDKLRMNSDKATIQMNLPMIILDGKELQLTEYKESNNFISNKTDETEESKNYLQTTLTNYGSNLPMIISDEVNKKKNHLLTAFINHSNNLPMIIPDNSTKFPLLTGTGTENGNLSDINKKTLYNDNNKESYQNPTSFENNITASDKKNCLKMSTDCFEVHKNMKNKTDYLCRNNNDCSLSPLTGKYEGTSSTTSVSLIPHSNKENMREETSKGNENKPTYDDPMTNIKLLHLEKVPFIQPKDLNYKHTQVPIKSINENANTEILNKRKINMINNQLQPPIKRTILHNEVKSIEKKENNPANKFERKKFNQIRQNNPNMKKAKNMKVTLKAVDQTSRQTLIPESKKMSPLTDKSPVFITPTHANRENNIIDNACTCHLRKPIKDKITVPQANIKLSGIRKPYKTINSSGNRKKNQRITDNKTLNSTTVSKVNLNPKYNITTENEQSIHQSLSEKAHGVKYRDKHELTETKTPPLDQSLQYENNTKLKVQGVKNVNNNLEYKEKLEITKVEIPAQDLDQSLQNEYISLKIQGLISRNNDNKNHDTKNVSSCLELNESNIFENKIDSSSFVLDTKNINNNYNDYEEESDMKYITSVKEVSDPKIPGASIKMITFNFIPECEKNTFDNINEIKNSKLESSLAIYQNNLSNLNDNTNKNLDKPRMSIIHNNNPSGKTDTITTTNNKSNTVSSKLNLPNSNPKREILVSTLKKNNTLYEKHKVLDETNTGTTEIPNDANKHSTAEAVMYDTDQQVQSINKQEDKKDYEDLYYSDENYDDSKYIISSNETDDSDISGIKSFRFNFAQPRMEGNATNDAEDNINDNMKK